IPTPEGIELTLRLAGPLIRLWAWVLDTMLRAVILFDVSIALSLMGAVGTGVLLVLWFVLEWLYPTIFEVYFGGATLGKRAAKLTVLHADGTPVGLPASLTRNLLRAVDFLPLFYGFGLAAMIMSRDFQRLGDIAAGTVVVYRETAFQHSAVPLAVPLPPPVPLTAMEQRTVLDLAARSQTLTSERAQELASLAPRVTGGREGTAALGRILSIANYLIGRRAT
ncbi:MAG TPA: RDD family protein, partial [Burkholderiales bacterium]|nr:RDD family protein [Burkholderiales bacterium]